MTEMSGKVCSIVRVTLVQESCYKRSTRAPDQFCDMLAINHNSQIPIKNSKY